MQKSSPSPSERKLLKQIFGLLLVCWGTLVLIHGRSDPEAPREPLTVTLAGILLVFGVYLFFQALKRR